MPNIASIVALSVHTSPTPKGQGGASGKKDGVRPDFSKLLREQTGLHPPLLEIKHQSSAIGGRSKLISSSTKQGSSMIESPIDDQNQPVTNTANPDTGIVVGVKTVAATEHAKMPNLLPGESGGISKFAIAAGIPDKDSSTLKQALSIESSKSKDMPHSDGEVASRENGKREGSSIDRKENTEIPDSTLAPGQIFISLLSPSPSLPSVLGATPEQAGGGNPAPSPAEIPRGETDQSRVREPERPTETASTPQAGISPAALCSSESEFDISGDNGVKTTFNLADDAHLKPATLAPQVKRVDSDKLLSGIGTASVRLQTSVAHGATEAPASAGLHMAATPSAAAGATGGAAVNSSEPATPNLYDRIDQGIAPVVLHSGAQHVSVGVHDPDLGWVEIQTQGIAGHVDATLVTPSGQSHASLAAQLPAMAQYLAQQDVKVGTLVVHHHALGGGSGGSSGGSGHGSANSGAGAHHSNPGNSGGERSAPPSGGPPIGHLRPQSEIDVGVRTGDDGAAFRAVSYISVRA